MDEPPSPTDLDRNTGNSLLSVVPSPNTVPSTINLNSSKTLHQDVMLEAMLVVDNSVLLQQNEVHTSLAATQTLTDQDTLDPFIITGSHESPKPEGSPFPLGELDLDHVNGTHHIQHNNDGKPP